MGGRPAGHSSKVPERQKSPLQRETRQNLLICLSCGARMTEETRFPGSLRCARCRTKNAPLDPDLTAHWRRAGAHF